VTSLINKREFLAAGLALSRRRGILAAGVGAQTGGRQGPKFPRETAEEEAQYEIHIEFNS